MGRKLGLTLEQVVAASAEVADRDGLGALSLASVASTLGVLRWGDDPGECDE